MSEKLIGFSCEALTLKVKWSNNFRMNEWIHGLNDQFVNLFKLL